MALIRSNSIRNGKSDSVKTPYTSTEVTLERTKSSLSLQSGLARLLVSVVKLFVLSEANGNEKTTMFSRTSRKTTRKVVASLPDSARATTARFVWAVKSHSIVPP